MKYLLFIVLLVSLLYANDMPNAITCELLLYAEDSVLASSRARTRLTCKKMCPLDPLGLSSSDH